MRNLGSGRRKLSLAKPPIRTFGTTRSFPTSAETPVFEPYEENLPLHSGYYTFVIDEFGQFRVVRGNTRSHARLVGGKRVGAAGHFIISRSGSLAEVCCTSNDYSLLVDGPADRVVRFVIEAFRDQEVINTSDHLLFSFRTQKFVTDVFVDINGVRLDPDQVAAKRDRLRSEQDAPKSQREPSHPREGVHASCVLEAPPALYAIDRRLMVAELEEDTDTEEWEPGDSQKPLAPEALPLSAGRNNFVIDREGRLIVGVSGHHLLSGGQSVGAAGQLEVLDDGAISRINLNFSGHYRPTLRAAYAIYTYRTLVKNPLLRFTPGCRILGRKCDGDGLDELVEFSPTDFDEDDYLAAQI